VGDFSLDKNNYVGNAASDGVFMTKTDENAVPETSEQHFKNHQNSGF
jgi:hypothetical protein